MKKVGASKQRRLIVALVVVAIVAFIGLAGFGTYAVAQAQARDSLVQANATAEASLRQFETSASGLEKAITSAQSVLDASAGKTLNETVRTALKNEISLASSKRDKAAREARLLATAITRANTNFDELIAWPPSAFDTATQIRRYAESLGAELEKARKLLSPRVTAVVTAQKAWQAEQDRIATEAAALAAEEAARAQAERLSKPKQIDSESSLSPTGGATAPTAPPPPEEPAPVDAGFDIDAYLSEFLASSDYTIQYVNGLCDGYYVCGRTLVGGGAIPVIQLDANPSVLEIYSTDAGKYVLVHEAAHVRQFWFYGTVALMISESGKFVDYPGSAAVEYMADCATIGRIGYALAGMSYPYTSSCTPEQYAEAARIW